MSSTDPGFEIVVGADGGIAPRDLARFGVRPGEHLRVVYEATKRPPFRSAAGILVGSVPALSWEDFEAGSQQAVADAEAGPTYPAS